MTEISRCQEKNRLRYMRAYRRSDWLGFGPASVGHWPDPFFDRNELIRRQLLEIFVESAGPIDVDVNGRVGPQAEMQTGVVTGKKAGLAQHGLRLGLAAVMD